MSMSNPLLWPKARVIGAMAFDIDIGAAPAVRL